MFQTYQPSGKIGVLTWPLFLLGIGLAIGFAFVYQYLLKWIPIIYVNVLLTWGLGFILGGIGVRIVKTGPLRNIMVAVLIGILIAVAAISAKFYIQYARWLSAVTQVAMDENNASDDRYDEIRKQVAAEFDFMEYIKIRTDEGFKIGRGGGGFPVKGIFVYGIWLIEFGVVAWFAVKLPRAAASRPYSEKLAAWASEEESVMTLPVTDSKMVARIKASTSVEELLQIPIPGTDVSKRFAVYRVNSIPGQELEDAYLSVDLLSYTTTSNGETETTTEPLVKHAILSSDNRSQLVENASLLQEAMAAYRESIDSGQQTEEESDGSGNDNATMS